MQLKYFGTDGIRGPAFSSPLTIEEVKRWGQAWAKVACAKNVQEFVIGWDPRLSSEPLVRAFIAGMHNALKVSLLGIVPTPVVAYITSIRQSAWGIVFSASHNQPKDNGIKCFNNQGEKISENDELAIETAFTNIKPINNATDLSSTNLLNNKADAQISIMSYIQQVGKLSIPDNMTIVIDCAHGATGLLAKELIIGNNIHWLGVPADGARINLGVGSSNIDYLATKVQELHADLGIAFDGDGDRCLMVDNQGNLIDGDQLLWLIVQHLISQQQPLPGVVGTVMSNGGLEQALHELNIPFVRTAVGDKYMLRELSNRNWWLAAEASGHIIQKQIGPSGDGIATALNTLPIILGRSKETRWSWKFKPWHMRLINISTKNHKPLIQCQKLQSAIKYLRDHYHTTIRTVIRWSGTETKLRIMAEAKDLNLTNSAIDLLEQAAYLDLNIK